MRSVCLLLASACLLFAAACASTVQKADQSSDEEERACHVFFRLVLEGKEEQVLQMAMSAGEHEDYVNDLYVYWSDEDHQTPPPEQLANFYEFCCKHFPLSVGIDTYDFACSYYEWQYNKRKVEDPDSLKHPYLEIQTKLEEVEDKVSKTETEEEFERWVKVEEELQEKLKEAEKDYLETADDLQLYSFVTGQCVPLLYEGAHEKFYLMLERFPDSMFTACALLMVGDDFCGKDTAKLMKLYDEIAEKQTSPMGKFILRLRKYNALWDDPEFEGDRQKLLDEVLSLAPSPRVKALLLYESMVECDADYAAYLSPEEASKPARRLVEIYPRSRYAVGALNFMVSSFCWNNDLPGAQRLIDEYRKKYPKTDLVSMGLFTLAREYNWRGGTGKSLEILREVVREHPDSSAAAYASLGMGEIYEKLGDKEKAIEFYSKAASFKEAPGTRELTHNIMDASNTRDRATEALATLLEKMDRYEEALKWYRAWEPSGGCLNYLFMQWSKRRAAIARVLLAMGKREEAKTYLRDSIHEGFSTPNFSEEIYPAVQYVNLVVEDGARLEDLESEFKKLIEKDKYNEAAQVAYSHVKLLKQVQKEGLAVVFGLFKSHRQRDDWRTLAIRDILKKSPEKAFDGLLARLPEHDWHIAYYLGELGDKQAIKPLVDALFKVKKDLLCGDLAEALVKLGSDSVPGLIRCLDAPEKRARSEAAEALGELGDSRAFESLLAELGKGRIRVGIVADALAAIGDKRAVTPMMEIFLKRNEGSFRVLYAVRKLTNQRFALDKELPEERQSKSFDLWEKWWQENRHKYQK